MSKTPTTAIKVITVSFFTLLIICFVSYRVGAFDNFSFSSKSTNNYSPNELNSEMAIDTPIVKKDSIIIDREMMSSSKSIMIPKSFTTDTIKAKPNNDTTKKKPLKKSTTMSSSKSGFIYEPEPDTTKKPK
jgi:hypothetical protein